MNDGLSDSTDYASKYRDTQTIAAPMMIQGFVFTWRGQERKAEALERRLQEVMPVSVINSDPSVRDRHPNWIHLPESAYFAAQWNQALALFNGDVLFHIQADADSEQLLAIISKAKRLFARRRIGVYEPNIDYTDIQYNRALLRSVEDDIVEVPWTDCTCWFISGDVIRQCRPFKLSVNTYGWGVCRVIAAISCLSERLCVRDYGFRVVHPKARGYPSHVAMHELQAYIADLPQSLSRQVAQLALARKVVACPPR